MELQPEAELLLARSFHDNRIRFQASRSVRSSARAFQTYAGFRARFTNSPQTLHLYAASAISYLKHHRFGLVLKTDADLQSSRVAMHIR